MEDGYTLIHTMGSMMKNGIIGGQIIYPIVDDKWKIDKEKKKKILSQVFNAEGYISIQLGGYLVIGGEQNTLNILLKDLPKINKYPFQLPYHAAFHTPLLQPVSKKACDLISPSFFKRPSIPLIDGRGSTWTPYSSSTSSLYDYTLNEQVINTFNFSTAVSVALKEYCPDNILLLGPGNSLGGVIGQVLVSSKWLGIHS